MSLGASLALRLSRYGYVFETGRVALHGRSLELLNNPYVTDSVHTPKSYRAALAPRTMGWPHACQDSRPLDVTGIAIVLEGFRP